MRSKELQISLNLERKRAKYTVEDVQQLCGGISRSTVIVRSDVNDWPVTAHVERCASLKNTSRDIWRELLRIGKLY
jgi:hypothetical protein